MCVENECMKEINTKNVTGKVHSKCVSGTSEILREQSIRVAQPYSLRMLLVDVNSNGRQGGNSEAGVTIAANDDGRTRVHIIADNDVAVVTSWQTRLQLGRPRRVVVTVHRDEALVATAECNTIVVVAILPGGNAGGTNGIAPANHVSDGRTAVFADPMLTIVTVLAVLNTNGRRSQISVRRREVVTGHHADTSIGPGQHENVSKGVQVTVLVGELGATVALSVMVVQENRRGGVRQHSPRFTERFQVLHLSRGLDIGIQVVGIVKFRHLANRCVHAWLDGFTRSTDDFLSNVSIAGQGRQQGLQLTRILVLGRINTETTNAHVVQIHEVATNLRLNVRGSGRQVRKAHQVTGLHIVLISVVVDLAIGHFVVGVMVEVRRAVDGESARGVRATTDTSSRASSHVVNHRINNDGDIRGLASGNHTAECGFITGAGNNLVSDWLVTSPPFRALDVLHGGRHLHGTISLRAQKIFAFRSNISP